MHRLHISVEWFALKPNWFPDVHKYSSHLSNKINSNTLDKEFDIPVSNNNNCCVFLLLWLSSYYVIHAYCVLCAVLWVGDVNAYTVDSPLLVCACYVGTPVCVLHAGMTTDRAGAQDVYSCEKGQKV